MSEIITGFDTAAGGMNNLFSPELIGSANYAKAVNVFTWGGKVKTRPGYTKLSLIGDATVISNFETMPWQGGAIYRHIGNDYLIAAAGGRLFLINLNTRGISQYAVMMDPYADRMWFCAANKYMIVQDGVSRPAIIQGSQISQSNTDSETDDAGAILYKLPVGRAMVYGHGRIFVQVSDRLFLAGDILLQWAPESIFGFEETTYYAGGGALSIPAELGNITALIMRQNVLSGTGTGALLVFCENGVSAFNISALRSTWATIDISQVLFTNAGAVGQSAVVPVNNDIIFRGFDGIRSLTQSASNISGGSVLRNMPFSEGIEGIMSEDTPWMLKDASIALMDNRLYCTTGGEMNYVADTSRGRIANQTVFNGIVTCDLRSPNGAVWESILTGLKTFKVMAAHRHGREKLLIAAWDEETEKNAIYILDDAVCGQDGTKKTPIKSRLYTRSYDFSTSDVARGALEKRFVHADFDLKDARRNVRITLYARAGGQAAWVKCGEFELAAGMDMLAGQTLLPQSYRRQRITAPDYGADDAGGRDLLIGKTLEFCIEWTGHMTIDRVIFTARTQERIEHETPTLNPTEQTLEGLTLYDYDYAT
jgi:hypothetical protein